LILNHPPPGPTPQREGENRKRNIVSSYTTGEYTTTSKNITGKDNNDRTTSIEIGKETLRESTLGIKFQTSNFSFLAERSFHVGKFTINHGNSSDSYELGIKGFDFYFRRSHGEVSENTISGAYEQYNVNIGVVLVLVFAGAEIKAAKKVIDVIGGLVNSVGAVT